jgi:beta-xylosidase
VLGTPTHLLTTQDSWEKILIENPAMIRYRKHYYLFYSGGSYADDSYATGYARCSSPTGPCTRVTDQPLLATGGRVSGPGGATPFVDQAGRLRLAYAAWDFGNTGYPKTSACRSRPQGCPQRKLHIATLKVQEDGNLVVTARG